MTDTALVTGGAGFIGSHLATALLAEHEVRVLDDFSTGKREWVPDAAQEIEGDVTDPETVTRAMRDVDVVFHQAANVSVERSVEVPEESHEVNVDGTLAVLEAARKENARVVLASSAAVYGHPESVPISELAPKTPTSPYGLEKLTADHYARLYHDLYGVETVALRYFNVYGPRQGGEYSGVIDVFIDQARADDPITVHGAGDQTRDFVHVRDVVQANLRAATTPHVGEAFNIGTGQSVTIRELADIVSDVTDADGEIRHVDPRTGDIERSCADISKARKRLDYRPTVHLRDGLAALVADTGDYLPSTDAPTSLPDAT